MIVILIFRAVNDESVISALFTVAGYTYGPLLGMFFFGLFTRRRIRDGVKPFIAILSPILCFIIDRNSVFLFGDYKFGFELLILNGLLTLTGMLIFSTRAGADLLQGDLPGKVE